MSEAELIFTALAELSTRQIAESVKATGMDENTVAGKQGGGIAKKARLELEKKTKKKPLLSASRGRKTHNKSVTTSAEKKVKRESSCFLLSPCDQR